MAEHHARINNHATIIVNQTIYQLASDHEGPPVQSTNTTHIHTQSMHREKILTANYNKRLLNVEL